MKNPLVVYGALSGDPTVTRASEPGASLSGSYTKPGFQLESSMDWGPVLGRLELWIPPDYQ